MAQLSAPASVTQNIARAKSLIKRNEIVRAINALSNALEGFVQAKTIGKARYATEVNILECVTELNAHPVVRDFLLAVSKSPKTMITYTAGGEAKLLTVLGIISKALTEQAAAKERAAVEAVQNRKEMLFVKAVEQLKAGGGPRAKSGLRSFSEEFGSEPGVLTTIGNTLVEADFEVDAIEFFEEAIRLFPRDPSPFGPLASCYIKFREFEKAEALYLDAIRAFGAHPKTMINLGKLYITWGKRVKAYEILDQVVRKYPNDEEAKELIATVDI